MLSQTVMESSTAYCGPAPGVSRRSGLGPQSYPVGTVAPPLAFNMRLVSDTSLHSVLAARTLAS
jgi:hypothetical protein